MVAFFFNKRNKTEEKACNGILSTSRQIWILKYYNCKNSETIFKINIWINKFWSIHMLE